MATWGIARAKAQLSEVVHQAEQGSPQTISRSGREVAVLISIEDWKRWNEEGTAAPKEVQDMADFIMNSPLHGLKMPRLRMGRRTTFE